MKVREATGGFLSYRIQFEFQFGLRGTGQHQG